MTKPGNYIVAAGVFIIVVFTGTWLISNAVLDSSTWIDANSLSAYNNTFNQFQKYNTQVSNISEQTTSTSGASSDSIIGDAFSFANNLINGGWNTIRMLWGTFDFIQASFYGLTTMWIPEWLVTIVVTLLLAMFIFGLLTVIFGKEVIGK